MFQGLARFFAALLPSCIILNAKQRTKIKGGRGEGGGGRGGGAGNKASIEIHCKEKIIYIYIGCVYQAINILHVALSTSVMYAHICMYLQVLPNDWLHVLINAHP